MAAFGAFEPAPRVAVALSGGSDSLALCLLADRWARKLDGKVLGLTVDHQLRSGSAEEAGRVGAWLRARGIQHEILTWTPVGRSQQAAREGRYRLLQDASRRKGIVHVLVGHTADDQAETVAFRRLRGSGGDGLAGIAAVRELDHVRLLRPLLSVGRDRLRATLQSQGQPWIDDPLNDDDRFARSRLRKHLAARPKAPALWTRLAHRQGKRRRRWDDDISAALARCTALHPAGYAVAETSILDHPMAGSLLGRIVRTVRGGRFAPAADRLAEICQSLGQGVSGQTIGGCHIARATRLVIAREAGRISDRRPVRAGETVSWDGRFVMTAPLDGEVACLGDEAVGAAFRALPATARRALPAVWHDGAVVAVPTFDDRPEADGSSMPATFRVRFRPRLPLAGAAFGCMFGVV